MKAILNSKDDLYAILGATKDSDVKEITRNHRRLALQLHPDKVASFSLPDLGAGVSEKLRKEKIMREEKARAEAGEAFLAVQRAYEVLTDKELRRTYDLGGITKVKEEERRGEMPIPPLWKIFALCCCQCLRSIDPSHTFMNKAHFVKSENGSFKKRSPEFSDYPTWSADERRSMRPPPSCKPNTFWSRMKWTIALFIIFSIFGSVVLNSAQTRVAKESSKQLRKQYDSVASPSDKLLGELFALRRRLPATLKDTIAESLPSIVVPVFSDGNLPLSPSVALKIQAEVLGELSLCASPGYAHLNSSLKASGVTPADHLVQVLRCARQPSHPFCVRQRESYRVLGDLLLEAHGTTRSSLPQHTFMSAIAPLLHLCLFPEGTSASETTFSTLRKRLTRYTGFATHLDGSSRLTIAAALEQADDGKNQMWNKIRIQEEAKLQKTLTTQLSRFMNLRKNDCRRVEKIRTLGQDKWNQPRFKTARQIVSC